MAKRGGAKHGGKRQGTPGKAYLNRVDLMHNYAPQTPDQTAAAGPWSSTTGPSEVSPAQANTAAPQPRPQTWMTPDEVPSLTDPGLAGSDPMEGLGQSVPMPAPDYVNRLYAAYNLNPTPQLRNALNYMFAQDI